ncbi:carbohydrate esterase family 1 protein [Mytilinidion resinicola]|uniref:feruloyl esterase n=1 Tax=Mytilinidion resinicola TaxID=574789 RepID=A0A6A6YH99_9PEZI|nr:carbohydrate esterase family 1 protein [Mytilinidion resinicola]KAF2807903.1 carbohydrate esterase family 1 protein [Mytilinidion resinicola]
MRLNLAAVAVACIAAATHASPATSPQRAAASGTKGCGKTHYFNGITQYFGFKSSGRDRKYSIHLPVNYQKSKPYPLVLGFHGSDSVGLFFEADTKMSESRFSGNKIMVYPDGIGGAWAGANYSKVSVAEDLQFVADLLDEIRGGYCIDNDRIYATGMSNGGGFVNTIACNEVGGEFAAFAPASGSYYTDNDEHHDECKPASSPLPLLEIHGGSDKSVHYEGGEGEGGDEPAIPDWLSWWAERNGCTSVEQDDSFNGDVHHITWTCDGLETLQHWKVDDMGHCWASTEINFSQISVGEGPTHIQASDIIMKFFDQFSKP